jgi:hypothetical protein
MYLRRCHLAYLKLSEAAQYRLSKAYISWIEEEGKVSQYEFSLDAVETRKAFPPNNRGSNLTHLDPAGYLLITTSVDERSHGHTETYER